MKLVFFFLLLELLIFKAQEIMPEWPHVFSGTIQCASGRLLLPEATVSLMNVNITLATSSLTSSQRISKWKMNGTITAESKPYYRFSNICNYNDSIQEKIIGKSGRPKEVSFVVNDSHQAPIKLTGHFNCSLGHPFPNGSATFGESCFDNESLPSRLELIVKTKIINSQLARYTFHIPASLWPIIVSKIISETPCFILLKSACGFNDTAVAPIEHSNGKVIGTFIEVVALPSPGPYLDCVNMYVKKNRAQMKNVMELIAKHSGNLSLTQIRNSNNKTSANLSAPNHGVQKNNQ